MNVPDTIRRLLNLATSSNEHEAAAAAAKAQELILKHNVSEDEIARSGGDYKAEPIGDVPFAHYKGKVPQWHVQLAIALARAFMCKIYYMPGARIHVVGRTTNREAFTVTWAYVRDQIDRLSHEAWAKTGQFQSFSGRGEMRAWRVSFCFGATHTVSQRMSADMKKLEAPGAVINTPEVLALRHSAIVLKSRLDEVTKWVDQNLKLRASAGARVSRSDAYSQGKATGHSVSLSARGSKKLGA